MTRGRTSARGGGGFFSRGGGAGRGGRGGFTSNRGGGAQRGGRRGWRDWEKVCLMQNYFTPILNSPRFSPTETVKLRSPFRRSGRCLKRSSSTVWRSCGSRWTSRRICACGRPLRGFPNRELILFFRVGAARPSGGSTRTTKRTIASRRSRRGLCSWSSVSSTMSRLRRTL